MSMIYYIAGFAILFGVLVFLHELGHFLAAKFFGIGVEIFSLGFGPRVFGFKRGETDYRVSAIPLGGYVKIYGAEQEVAPNDKRAFYNHPLHHQFIVLIAGALANLLLGIVFFSLVNMIGIMSPKYLEEPPTIAWVYPDSPAEKVGVRMGDRIVSVGRLPVQNWQEALNAIHGELQPIIRITVARQGTTLTLTLEGRLQSNRGNYFYGLAPYPPLVVRSVFPDTPAAKLGLRKGDIIFRVNERDVLDLSDFKEALTKLEDQPFQLSVKRGEEILVLHTRAAFDSKQKTYILGFATEVPEFHRVRYSIIASFKKGFRDAVDNSMLFFRAVGKLATGRLSIKTLSGPIGIAKFAGEFLAMGLSWFFTLMGAISIQLGIINLLPIPALDGGHAIMVIVSGLMRRLTGRGLSPQFREKVTLVGALFLIALMIVVVALDILKILG